MLSWMFQHGYLDTYCFECLICMCFVFLYLDLFSATEHVSLLSDPVGVWSNHLGPVPETADRQAGAYIARNMIRSTRGNSLKLLKPRHRLNMRGNYFANRVVNLWNSHPDNVITAPSVDSFKRRLDKHWAALPSMYDPECLA